MNKTFFSAMALAALTLTACKKEVAVNETAKTDSTTAVVTTNETAPVAGDAHMVDTAVSNIDWEGGKMSGDKHTGTIKLQDGTLTVNNGKIVGGKVTIDMKTITVTDLPDAADKARLEGHLKGTDADASKSDHFFNVNKYPTATLDITKVTENGANLTLDGNLTMKGKTVPVQIAATQKVSDAQIELDILPTEIDRTKWGINFSSGSTMKDMAADKIINDKIKISGKVIAKK